MESQVSARMFSLTWPTIGLSDRTVAMLFAPSCNCTCSSCQSPQSSFAGVFTWQLHVGSASLFWQVKLTRATLLGLRNTPLTKCTPELSSLASM